jgi:predicted MFS family arabinose efflux permease
MVGRARSAVAASPLTDRNFALLCAGQFTSTVGDYCYAVALPWLVLSSRGGPVLLGTVLACYGVPRTALIPVGGVLADKLAPRKVMLAADAVRAVLVAALVVFAVGHVASLAALAPVAALLGAGAGIFIPASFAIIPGLLSPSRLQAGNALNSAIVQLGSLAGPALGGALVATVGPAPGFAVDAASFVASAVTLALIRRGRAAGTGSAGEPSAGDRGPDGTAGRRGLWRLLATARVLQVLLVVTVMANLAFAGTFEVALPALAHARFGAAGYGALIACFGAGGVAGTLAAARGGTLRRPAVAAAGSFLLAAASTALIPFLGGLTGAAVASFALGSGAGFGNVTMITLLQRWAPQQLLGRVMSLVMLSSMGTFPVSVAVAGLLVRAVGPAAFFPVAGAALAVAVGGALTQRAFRRFGMPGVSWQSREQRVA